MGYLVCDKCGGYYKLQEGESAEDFENCQCGGKLRYVDSFDEYLNDGQNLTEDSTIKEADSNAIETGENLQMDVLYEETIFLRWLAVSTILIFGFLLYVLFYQILVIPTEVNPLINILLTMVLLFILFSVNFTILRIKMNQQYLSVSCGIFKHNTPWEDINDFHIDEPPTARYTGYGIRLGRFNGKWILGYVMGNPKVIISLNKGRFRDFAFTTKNPQEVVMLIKKQIE